MLYFTEPSIPDKAKTHRKSRCQKLEVVLHKEEVMSVSLFILRSIELFGEYVDSWWGWGKHYYILKFFSKTMFRVLF